MRIRNEESYQRNKEQHMEACFAAYAKGGLSGTGVKALAKECDCSTATLYTHFDNLDAQLGVLKNGIELFLSGAKEQLD